MSISLKISGTLLFASLSIAQAEDAAVLTREDPKLKIQSPAISEASGLAISSRDPNFMWIVNDSGAKPIVHLAGTDGTDRGQVAIDDARNVDWEDLASFKLDGRDYLLIADTGDNNSKRENSRIYIVEEPALPKPGTALAGHAKPAWTIDFTFEEGPRDCESVGVDASAGKILLISKRTKPPMVYELPLRPKKGEAAVAKKLGETSVQPPKSFQFVPYIAQPTGLSIAGDSTAAAVITYYGVFLFPRGPHENWTEAFAKTPVVLGPHGLEQGESVAFSKDGKTLTAVSEGAASPIIRYKR